MKCPYCGYQESKVIDSRSIDESSSIRRRRECLKCQARFNTYETVETIQIMVIKKDGSREYFDKSKMLAGIVKACQKRPVDSVKIANKVESDILNSMKQEISSQEIGELIMRELKDADAVAYVRFASIYRDFQDVETFMKELRKFLKL
ncbi:MAG: transcriptional repressor NrdR [Clostridia bacterium]|nr:transcriptional repressor NrdR [Clostridia bacterium]MBO5440152.1 transcriptional repressor NrdR [Clostridia bacterium]